MATARKTDKNRFRRRLRTHFFVPGLKKEPKSRPPAPQDPPQDPSRRSILGRVAKESPQDCPQDPSRRSILGWVPKNGRRRVASRRLFWGGLQKMEGVGWPRDASKRHFRLSLPSPFHDHGRRQRRRTCDFGGSFHRGVGGGVNPSQGSRGLEALDLHALRHKASADLTSH